MDKNTLLLGKLLGEVYRLQYEAEMPTADTSTIYGLRNGFESVINEELERIGFISTAQLDAVRNVLNTYDRSKEKLESLSGFYQVEDELSQKGVGRGEAIRILTFLQASHRFTNVIAKFDSQHSPTECRTFELHDDEM